MIIKKMPLINVGSGKEYTIKEVALKICKIAKVNTKLVFNKSYPDGTKRKVVDNSIIKKLGWSSKISLDEGLLKTINWYKNNN